MKPEEAIIEAYSVGQRHFGENYLQELTEKATNEQILKECSDIRWHYIGKLQSNKLKKVKSVTRVTTECQNSEYMLFLAFVRFPFQL